MHWKNITIIGTSHISPESLNTVESTIIGLNPAVVAIELDRKRLAALLGKVKTRRLRLSDIRRIGVKGWLFSVIGAWIEHKLGEKVGVKPGSDMLKAFAVAQQTHSRVALIDQDIEITLKRFSQSFSWKEKWRILVDIVKGFVFRKSEFTFDLKKVPSHKIIEKMIKIVKRRYPNIYKVLIEERNVVMAKSLLKIQKDYPEQPIVAVVGAGHEKDIIALLKEFKY